MGDSVGELAGRMEAMIKNSQILDSKKPAEAGFLLRQAAN